MHANYKRKKAIRLGGADLERVYLYSCSMTSNNQKLLIKKSKFATQIDMNDVIMRHVGRYGLALPYIRPGYKILDFPCGSGLTLELFSKMASFAKFSYLGLDVDGPTILYCQKIYGQKYSWAKFGLKDLTNFEFKQNTYNTICCIEGIEHIDYESQKKAIAQFAKALKSGGTLILSSPAPEKNISGPNAKNPFHVWELTKNDLIRLLAKYFGSKNIELISQKNLLSSNQLMTTYYAICHKL